jgi:hypothetical protein
MRASPEPGAEHIEILPLTIVVQEFPARPSSLPDVRDFVRRQLTATPLSDDEVRTFCDRVADVLFAAAGGSGAIQVSLRMFPAWAEVDVLEAPGAPPAETPAAGTADVRPPVIGAGPSFAEWFTAGLRREGLTLEAAARRLSVSAKTVGRWAGGATEPRLRDLYRIREVFGEPPAGFGSTPDRSSR